MDAVQSGIIQRQFVGIFSVFFKEAFGNRFLKEHIGNTSVGDQGHGITAGGCCIDQQVDDVLLYLRESVGEV